MPARRPPGGRNGGIFPLTRRRFCGIIMKSNWGVLQLSQREVQETTTYHGDAERSPWPGDAWAGFGTLADHERRGLLPSSATVKRIDSLLSHLTCRNFLTSPGTSRFRYMAQRLFARRPRGGDASVDLKARMGGREGNGNERARARRQNAPWAWPLPRSRAEKPNRRKT